MKRRLLVRMMHELITTISEAEKHANIVKFVQWTSNQKRDFWFKDKVWVNRHDDTDRISSDDFYLEWFDSQN